MKKRNSLIILTGLMTLCTALACVFMPKSIQASAATAVSSENGEIVGASIRVDREAKEGAELTSTGIRFGYALDIATSKITFTDNKPNNIQNLGMEITIAGNTKDIPFYQEGKEVAGTDGIVREINVGDFDDKGNFINSTTGKTVLCMIYIYNFKNVDDYVLDIAAQGYIQKTGEGEALQTSASVTRSIAGVAREAYNDEKNAEDASLLSLVENFFVVKAEQELALFDSTKGTGEKTLAELFPKADFTDATVTATSVEETPVTTELTLADGAITTVPVDSKEVVKQVITLDTGKLDYQVTVSPYTAVIHNFTELKETFYKEADTSKTVTYDGYYILADNIACGKASAGDKATRYSLTGTFDGNGYKIDQITSPQYGLFGYIKGAIKNVAFTNVVVPTPNGNRTPIGVFNNTGGNPILENVYIGYAEGSYDNSSSSFMVVGRDGYASANVMKNVVVDLSKVTLTNQWNVRIFAQYWTSPFSVDWETRSIAYNNNWTKNNGLEATVNANVQNVYVISKAPLMYQKLTSKSGEDSLDVVYVLDGGNRQKDETLSYLADADKEKPNKVAYFAGVSRYDTYEEFANATKGGVDESFGALWTVDKDNGLVWAGK